jgi:hypothetical protein
MSAYEFQSFTPPVMRLDSKPLPGARCLSLEKE